MSVSKATPVQYIPYCTLNGVYTRTSAKVMAKINIDQNYLVKSPHSAEVTAGNDFGRGCLPYGRGEMISLRALYTPADTNGSSMQ